MDALGFFQGIQILALHVFDQGHGGRGLVVHVLDQHRHLGQPGDLGRAEAAFAGDDLVGIFPVLLADGADQDGLQQTLFLDRGRQFIERAFIHAGARLVLAGLQFGHGHHRGQALRSLRLGFFGDIGGAAEKRVQSASQTLGFFR